jgi:hypothetical protein
MHAGRPTLKLSEPIGLFIDNWLASASIARTSGRRRKSHNANVRSAVWFAIRPPFFIGRRDSWRTAPLTDFQEVAAVPAKR